MYKCQLLNPFSTLNYKLEIHAMPATKISDTPLAPIKNHSRIKCHQQFVTGTVEQFHLIIFMGSKVHAISNSKVRSTEQSTIKITKVDSLIHYHYY